MAPEPIAQLVFEAGAAVGDKRTAIGSDASEASGADKKPRRERSGRRLAIATTLAAFSAAAQAGPLGATEAGDYPKVAQASEKPGRPADAEPFYKHIMAVREKALGPDQPLVARTLDNLAELYVSQGRDADAEALYRRSLAIREKALGPDHPEVAKNLDDLARLYVVQGRYAEADPLYERSAAIRKKALGSDRSNTGSLLDLAELCIGRGRCADAEPLYGRLLAIERKALESRRATLGEILDDRAEPKESRDRSGDSEPHPKRSVAMQNAGPRPLCGRGALLQPLRGNPEGARPQAPGCRR